MTHSSCAMFNTTEILADCVVRILAFDWAGTDISALRFLESGHHSRRFPWNEAGSRAVIDLWDTVIINPRLRFRAACFRMMELESKVSLEN